MAGRIAVAQAVGQNVVSVLSVAFTGSPTLVPAGEFSATSPRVGASVGEARGAASAVVGAARTLLTDTACAVFPLLKAVIIGRRRPQVVADGGSVRCARA